eukprot:5413819-Lingulodinium_polyedra.AAC.1
MSLGSSSLALFSVGAAPPLAWPVLVAAGGAAEPARGPAGRLAPHRRHVARDAQFPGQAQSVQVQSCPLAAPLPTTCSTFL